MIDHYAELGVARDASPDDIKKAYRRKSSNAHPDKDGGSQEAMQRINAAYAVLGDDSKRKHYDATGQDNEPSIERQAQSVLLSLFNELLEADEATDFLGIARKAVNTRISGLKMNIEQGRRRVNTIERKRGKVRRKDAGPNAVDMLIEQKIGKLKAAIEDLTEGLKVHQHALVLLNLYESTEPAPFEPMAIHRPMFVGVDFGSNIFNYTEPKV